MRLTLQRFTVHPPRYSWPRSPSGRALDEHIRANHAELTLRLNHPLWRLWEESAYDQTDECHYEKDTKHLQRVDAITGTVVQYTVCYAVQESCCNEHYIYRSDHDRQTLRHKRHFSCRLSPRNHC